MHPSLDSLQRSYAEALGGLSAAEAQSHPKEDLNQWSAQELVEHLILTFRSTAGVLEERLQKGRPTQAPLTPEHEARWRKTIQMGVFPEGGKAPERVRPGQLHLGALSGAELALQFKLEMERVDSLLDQCAERFGPQRMASHFAFGPLSAEQWREFHTVHGRHHLAQMSRILAGIQKDL
jgi:DinB superfamily